VKREILATWDNKVTRTRQRGKTAGKYAKIDSAPSAVSLHKYRAGRPLALSLGDGVQKQSPSCRSSNRIISGKRRRLLSGCNAALNSYLAATASAF